MNQSPMTITIDTIIDYYFDYYHSRLEKSLTFEKATSSFVKYPDDRNMARKTLLTYPVKILSKKGFIEYDKGNDMVYFTNTLYSKFRNIDFNQIKALCQQNLKKYYLTLE